MSFWEYNWVSCPDRPHRFPEGPCEDVAQCHKCGSGSFILRPPGETYGLHDDDCSLPERHEYRCVGGGVGHAQAPVIRGWFGAEFESQHQAQVPAREAGQNDQKEV